MNNPQFRDTINNAGALITLWRAQTKAQMRYKRCSQEFLRTADVVYYFNTYGLFALEELTNDPSCTETQFQTALVFILENAEEAFRSLGATDLVPIDGWMENTTRLLSKEAFYCLINKEGRFTGFSETVPEGCMRTRDLMRACERADIEENRHKTRFNITGLN